MTRDYKSLGLKCGIEIHQQLDTHKLFCPCPSVIREDEPDVMIKRKMRAVAGELGDIDPAALHEFLKDRELIYEAYSDTNCLVELDEEPPHPLNREALEIVLKISLLLNAKPVDELQVMRKTVIDGSNTSGFQRTVLVAMNGFLDTKEGRIGIPTICLEEDAARKIEEKENRVVYRLDRLGIPLAEIATTPEIKSPKHAREVAEKLGMILRATGRVKRGLGTIRQDLNVSISNGERIEVKGVQDLRLISKVVENEVERQLKLIEVMHELKKRRITEKDLKFDAVDVTSIFRETTSKVIKSAIEKNGVVLAVELKGFSGLLKNKLGPELAQYARVTGIKGIFHSDELPNYGIGEQEISSVNQKLELGKEDAFVLVAEKKDISEKALKAVINRCKIALKGVPKETRRAKEDGSSEFMRPLPGSARMYPETDEELIVIDKEWINEIKKKLPKLPEEKKERYMQLGLGEELANQLLRSELGTTFEEFIDKFREVKPSIIATTILSTPKEVKKRYSVDIEKLTARNYEDALSLLNDKKISKDAIPEILSELAKTPEKSADEIVEERNLALMSGDEVNKIVNKIIEQNSELAIGQLIGRVMIEVRGRADVELVKSMIIKKLNK